MAFDLTEFAKDTAEVTIEIGSQTVEVTYKPSMITADALALGDTEDSTLQWLTECITKWNLTKGTKKVPITVAELRKLPTVLVNKMVTGILRDDPVGEAESSSSNG